MSKYSIENSQVGAIGDNAIANNIVFNGESIHEEDVDLEKLKEELTKLKNIIEQKENKSIDEYKLLVDVVEIEEFVTKKDVHAVINKVKACANSFFYTMSTGIGSSILANLISKVLNIN